MQFGIPIDHTLDLTEVASASNGEHVEDGGALCGFMRLAIARKLRPNAGLSVENFSRLSRLPIDDAMYLFLQIIRADVTLVTLTDRRAYTRASLRANKGEIHYVAAHLEAARAEAEAKGYYSRKSWVNRRSKVIDMYPGWVIPKADRSGYEAIAGAKLIFERIFLEGETLGDEKIAARLNAEGIKPFASWNHTPTIWHGNHIRRMIKDRPARGEREIAHYEGKKRTKTGEVIRAYLEMISEDQWKRTNAARKDPSRQKSTTGRKGDGFSNLFQHLAKCAHCGKAMKLSSTVKKGNRCLP
jgi:Recombinase